MKGSKLGQILHADKTGFHRLGHIYVTRIKTLVKNWGDLMYMLCYLQKLIVYLFKVNVLLECIYIILNCPIRNECSIRVYLYYYTELHYKK